MKIQNIMTNDLITELAKKRFQEERAIAHLEGWFRIKEIQRECDGKYADDPDSIRIARTLHEVMERLPIWISDYSIFAGTQDDAFARSYALINPAFRVDAFRGYCDPVAVFGDIDPIDDITQERIDDLRDYNDHTKFADALRRAYDLADGDTDEAIFFIEQVTGHVIPDLRPMLKKGIRAIQAEVRANREKTDDRNKKDYFTAMDIALDACLTLAGRYADLASEKAEQAKDEMAKAQFLLMANTLRKVPAEGAEDLYEAIQSFILIWETMCIEQAPNPYAFSVGNADRIFDPYRAMEETDRDTAAALFRHFLVFFNVADRSWAISQNLIVGGKSNEGEDLTNPTSYALMDAYYDMNLPQPILSTKLHKNTPDELYREMGRFFFTPGCLTPSLFNDDSVFQVLENKSHVVHEDLQDYSIAGCQEPLIMGKDNGNTTNSWLNLAKILELSINDGKSLITGRQFGPTNAENGCTSTREVLENIRPIFYKNTEKYVDEMVACANAASEAISLLQVPFLSSMMGGVESGIDCRDTKRQGTKYNGSGCLIHGLSVVADSFTAIDTLLAERPEDADRMLHALQTNFQDDREMQQYLLTAEKFGNNKSRVDNEAAEIAERVSDLVDAKKNYLSNPFRADWATPSTHLLYGYWVGATPDGREARTELNYGVDPLFGDATQGLGFRMLSNMKIPFGHFNGGYASHLGVDPKYFHGKTYEDKGIEFRNKIFWPLFFNPINKGIAPFYLYVNVTTPEMLRKVLSDPKKYAPSGVYIMRIHGTFVNFLDLSPDIQEDIIARLDPDSSALAS
jgi:pyruvate-formate lyase